MWTPRHRCDGAVRRGADYAATAVGTPCLDSFSIAERLVVLERAFSNSAPGAIVDKRADGGISVLGEVTPVIACRLFVTGYFEEAQTVQLTLTLPSASSVPRT